ncbi:hypothetical protein ACWDUD_13895 [Rhodococcus sp. NPDC003382]
MPHVTFVHGIGNKPAPDQLLDQWRIALFDDDGLDLDAMGVTSSMVYWADMLYAQPAAAFTAHESTLGPDDAAEFEVQDPGWICELPDDEREFVERLGREVGVATVEPVPGECETLVLPDTELEAIPLPPAMKKRLMQVFLRDVHHFLYDASFTPRPGETFRIRSDIRERALKALQEGDSQPGPHVVVGHSLGSVIAYDALTAINDAPRVDALLTVGSPLGISEVQDGLTPPWTRNDGWPARCLGDGRWTNVYDPLDPVCGLLDRQIAGDFLHAGQRKVADVGVSNTGSWRHSIGKYLGQPRLRDFLRQVLE